MSLFGAPWDQLALEDVERFLADADAEPLLWEAKGRDPRDASKELDRHDLRKEICAFANGHEAGYLILGARQVAGRWKLDGGGWVVSEALRFPVTRARSTQATTRSDLVSGSRR